MEYHQVVAFGYYTLLPALLKKPVAKIFYVMGSQQCQQRTISCWLASKTINRYLFAQLVSTVAQQ